VPQSRNVAAKSDGAKTFGPLYVMKGRSLGWCRLASAELIGQGLVSRIVSEATDLELFPPWGAIGVYVFC
jgi:hypothetical protein